VGLALAAACSFDHGGSDGSRDGGSDAIDAATGDAAEQPDAGGPCTTGALDFSPDNWIEVADDSLDLTDDFAVEAWVRPRDIGGEHHIVSRHSDSASEGYVLMLKDSLPQFRIYYTDDSGPPSHCDCEKTGEEVVADQWVHLAGSFSGGTSYLFKDGVLIDICVCQDICSGNCDGEVASYDGPMEIGIEASRLDRFAADGLIDDVHVLSSPITASFDPKQSATCTADSLLLFRFDPPVGQELTSGCGTGVTGRLGSESGVDLNDPTAVDAECH
jgi:hypothetical protein